MTNLEHLVENELTLIEQKTPYREWRRAMYNDVNYEECNISLDDLWDICQYVSCTYVPEVL